MAGERYVYLYGFSKNQRNDVSPVQLRLLRKLAKSLLAMTSADLGKAVNVGELIEVNQNA